MSQHSEFEAEFHMHLNRMGKAFTGFPWEDEEAYVNWLAQTYFYVKHTTTMICMSAAAFGANNLTEFEQMLHHLAEERGHDSLLLQDLEVLGRSIEHFEEDVETGLFYQNQYYMIQNQGPESHLGYALLLEAMCANFGADVLRRVRKSHGTESCKFLDVHVVADQGHSGAGIEKFRKLPPYIARRVLRNMRQTVFLYELILKNAAARTKLKQAS